MFVLIIGIIACSATIALLAAAAGLSEDSQAMYMPFVLIFTLILCSLLVFSERHLSSAKQYSLSCGLHYNQYTHQDTKTLSEDELKCIAAVNEFNKVEK